MPTKPIKIKILMAFSILLAFASIVILFVPHLSNPENIDDELFVFLLILIVTGLTGFFMGSRRILAINFLCAGLLAFYLKTTTIANISTHKSNSNQEINIASIALNLVENDRFISSVLNDSTIHIVAFQQYNPDWDHILHTILIKDFPYQAKLIQLGQHGTALYSKIPVIHVDTFMLGNYPTIQTTFKSGLDTFNILSAYIPGQNESVPKNEIDGMYEDLRSFVSQHNRRNIIIGQFNQTYWSRHILHLKNTLHLYNSRRIIYPIVTTMPQDHIFYTGDLECYAFGEITGAPRTRIGSKAFFRIHQPTTMNTK